MGTIYGYARCSTDEKHQDIDRQKRELLSMGVSEEKYIYCEYESGKKDDRVELSKILDAIKEGDSIAVTEVSRLTRSTKQLCEILQIVQDKKIRIIIGNFAIDCRYDEIDATTKGMILMWGVFAEMERDIISQRVKSGMANAKAKGKKIGRPKVTNKVKYKDFLKHYPSYKNGNISITKFAKMLDCSRTTIYKYIKMVENSK